jgi:hypothetical protein
VRRFRGGSGSPIVGRPLAVDPAQEALFAHLCEVAASYPRVALEVDGQTVLGDLLLPDLDAVSVPFVPRGSIAPWLATPFDPRRQRPARLLYGSGSDRFSFTTRIMGPLGSNGTRLALPTEVNRQRARMNTRRDLALDPGWLLDSHRGDERFRVLDVSIGGVRLAFDRLAELPHPGRVLVGDLVAPGRDRRQIVRLRVVRPAEPVPDTRYMRVGCRVHQSGFGCIARITGLLFDAQDLVEELYARDPIMRG